MKTYYQYWGKAHPKQGHTQDYAAAYHLLPYHALDVAAVGRAYLQRHPKLLQLFTQSLQLDESALLEWFTFCFAVHDLGKFSSAFQNQSPTAVECLGRQADNWVYNIRHDTLGFLFWREHYDKQPFFAAVSKVVVHPWLQAVTGHHGQPPKVEQKNLAHYFSEQDTLAAKTFTDDAYEFFLSPATREIWLQRGAEYYQYHEILSWWVAGITVLADWLGSNQDYFAYQAEPMPLKAYWEIACEKAEQALQQSGALPVPAHPLRKSADLLPHLERFKPTPLQAQAYTLPLTDGPQLLILEDVTGAGKTEAALILAHRLLAAGQAQGIYVGLPTMATANAMYDRVEDVYARLFADGANPSLILAHSAKHLSQKFSNSILPNDIAAHDSHEKDQTASARCTAWLADGRKKALLAHVGVGTIDQALQAVTYSRHQSLRLLGLFQKVLIVDEVHACDAYMQQLLERLLQFHAAAGGQAILLSATLPKQMRESLARAFAKGREWPKPTLKVQDQYPLLTHIYDDGVVQEYGVDAAPTSHRTVNVQWCDSEAQAIEYVLAKAAASECVCWIRNTVFDAIAAYQQLIATVPDADKITLFHARFVMGDRLDIEQDVLKRFGKSSTPDQRAGQILIATQVVEQSLDIDFDHMISDLAPIDLLIQRAGRLHRHQRVGREQLPTLIVHGPQPQADVDGNWYKNHFPKAAGVYPNHGQLWITAKILEQKQSFTMPADARDLIEGVYGDATDLEIPEPLYDRVYDAESEILTHKSVATQNTLVLKKGYQIAGANNWWEDAHTPTRLGEASIMLRVFKWQNAQLTSWRGHAQHQDLSSMNVAVRRLSAQPQASDPELQQAIEQLLAAAKPSTYQWCALLILHADDEGSDEWRGEVIDPHEHLPKQSDAVVSYHLHKGLIF